VIQNDDQMLLAQQCTENLRRVLLAARKVHSREDYSRMAEPILLELQQREQEILEYLSSDGKQIAPHRIAKTNTIIPTTTNPPIANRRTRRW
jgi:hypothetical protein